MTTPSDLTVAVHAQLLAGRAGGIETNLLALLSALARERRAGKQIVIGPGGESDWLLPWLGPRQSILPWTPIRYEPAGGPRSWRQWVTRVDAPPQRVEGQKLTARLVEAGVQVVHFPYQRMFETSLPYIFEPWDLQHRHLPEFFSDDELRLREQLYREACLGARFVVTASRWTAADVVDAFGVDPSRIIVIRRAGSAGDVRTATGGVTSGNLAVPSSAHADATCDSVLAPLHLPARFVLFPAKTWRHKNHMRLMQALALLRDRFRIEVPLVCTGSAVEPYAAEIRAFVAGQGLTDLVHWAGFVTYRQMAALYETADAVVFPTLFEGLGLPLIEAIEHGAAIVSSDVTCLREYGGDAPIYVDPHSADSIANGIARLWQSADERAAARARSRRASTAFSWTEAARVFTACYRAAAGIADDGDVRLLEQSALAAATSPREVTTS
jgi:glycosyltransferase involved in cell wall biosynthesis